MSRSRQHDRAAEPARTRREADEHGTAPLPVARPGAAAAPSAADVLHLQRTIGNRAVGQLLARAADSRAGESPSPAPGGLVQRVKLLPNGAKVLESSDTEEKRKFYQGHIDKFEQLNKPEQAAKLKKEQAKFPALQEDEVLFTSVGLAQEPSTTYALFAHSTAGPYYVFPTSYGAPTDEVNATEAHGTYQFAVTVEHPNEVLVGTAGHDALARHGNVWYAGTVYFHQGALVRWNNDTGHYRTTPEHAGQATRVPTDDFSNSLLPRSAFEEFRH